MSTTAQDDSSTTQTPATESGVAFLVPTDVGENTGFGCDIWGQDCPPGEKCMPWANDGGSSWNATRCSPVAENPKQPGDACTVVESGWSGIDDCELGAMCWSVDSDTNTGECISLCQGDEANPVCPDPCTECVITSEGSLIPCLPICDPLAQDCPDDEACYPSSDAFMCAPDLSGESGEFGEACEFINVCNAGSFCGSPDKLPDCGGAAGCCIPYCDTAVPDVCDAIVPGTTCVPWFDDERSPIACGITTTMGACMVAS